MSQKQPKISIVVPVYNVEKYLDKCVNSLIYQTLRDIEIICVNDGSQDRSLEILQEYASHDSRIRVFDQANSGVSVARNNALKHVKGEYYMFVDSDDWLDPETCAVAYDHAKQHDADCLMYSYTKEFGDHSIVNHIFDEDCLVWDKKDVKQKFHRRLFGPIGSELKRPQDTDLLIQCWGQLFKTKKFASIPFVDIRKVGTFEDGLYQMAVYKSCEKFVYIDRPFYHYRKTNEGSITTRYKADLYDKWCHLYKVIDGYISEWNLPGVYNIALQNRIALGVLGLGLNQTHSSDSIIAGGRHLKKMLRVSPYKEALQKLNVSSMPLFWKVFILLAKWKLYMSLFAMLKLIEYLRTHKE